MKKALCSIAVCLLLLTSCGTAPVVETTSSVSFSSEERVSTTPPPVQHPDIGKYHYAEFDEYNSFASENGHGDEKIYFIGSPKDIDFMETEDGTMYYCTIDVGDESIWLVELLDESHFCIDAFQYIFDNASITACGTYQGYSAVEEKPVIFAEKFIIDNEEYDYETSYCRLDWLPYEFNETTTLKDMAYAVPDGWESAETTDPDIPQGMYYYPYTEDYSLHGIVYVSYSDDPGSWKAEDVFWEGLIEGMLGTDGELISQDAIEIGGEKGMEIYFYKPINDITYKLKTDVIPYNNLLYIIQYGEPLGLSANMEEFSASFSETIIFETAEEESAPQSESEPESDPEPEMTASQRNALASARSYLAYTAFSYKGLIHQLEYEKYSTDDATFAADHCGADWNEQALKSAKSYLDFTAFSYSGLIQQLEHEQFTTDEATYGADNCGADWMEQAAKSAESYLNFSSFSHDGLVDQLTYEGFTYEQAEYGVTQAGL